MRISKMSDKRSSGDNADEQSDDRRQQMAALTVFKWLQILRSLILLTQRGHDLRVYL